MRLVKSVERLERSAAVRARGGRKAPPKISFDWVDVDGRRRSVKTLAAVWTEQEDRLGRDLAAGEHLAVDLHLLIHEGGDVSIVRAVERAALDAADVGRVIADGRDVGRVLELRGQLLLVGWAAAESGAPA